MLLVVFGLVYFFFLRPRRNRSAPRRRKKREVAVGDEITTTAGLIATVVAIDDDALTLEIAPGVQCRYLPAAVLRVNGPDEEPEPDAPDASTHEVIEDPDASSRQERADRGHPRRIDAGLTERVSRRRQRTTWKAERSGRTG